MGRSREAFHARLKPMWRASRTAAVVAGLLLLQARPALTTQATSPAFDRLFAAYAAGDTGVVASTIKTVDDFSALEPGLNTALTSWHINLTRQRALFLLEIAAVSAGKKWPIIPVKGSPPFFEQVGLVWMRGTELGTTPRDDAFEVMFHKTVIALMEKDLADPATAVDHYVSLIDARFGHSRLATAERPVLDARFDLAKAMAPDLVLFRRQSLLSIRNKDDADVEIRFKKAMEAPDALPETFVRGAMLKLRFGKPVEAIAALDQFKDDRDDAALTYWAWLFRGRALAALDRAVEADVAYRSALAAWPHAQSAAAALTSLFLFWNNPAEAHRWSIEVTTAPADTIDPWWFYGDGDYRFLAKWLTSLREAAR
jgi:hypothetical protein